MFQNFNNRYIRHNYENLCEKIIFHLQTIKKYFLDIFLLIGTSFL